MLTGILILLFAWHQVMIEKLLAMLQDTDYRVRLFLARKVAILFLTWDGHNELFHDIWYVSVLLLVINTKLFINTVDLKLFSVACSSPLWGLSNVHLLWVILNNLVSILAFHGQAQIFGSWLDS